MFILCSCYVDPNYFFLKCSYFDVDQYVHSNYENTLTLISNSLASMTPAASKMLALPNA